MVHKILHRKMQFSNNTSLIKHLRLFQVLRKDKQIMIPQWKPLYDSHVKSVDHVITANGIQQSLHVKQIFRHYGDRKAFEVSSITSRNPLFSKKSLKIPKRYSESVYRRRTDNTMVKRKRKNNNLQNIHIKPRWFLVTGP